MVDLRYSGPSLWWADMDHMVQNAHVHTMHVHTSRKCMHAQKHVQNMCMQCTKCAHNTVHTHM